MNSLEIRRKRATLVKQGRDILDKAEAEKRDLSQEEQNQWKGIMTDVNKLGEQAERMEQQELLERGLGQSGGTAAGGGTPGDHPPGAGAGGDNRQHPLATDEYRNVFRRYLRQGLLALGPSDVQHIRELRALQADDNEAGGYLQAPPQFVAELLKDLDNQVMIRQWATVIQVPRAESLGRPYLKTDIDDADWTTELATGNEDSSLDFGKRELRAHPMAKRIKVSNKLLRVGALDAEAIVRQRIAYKTGVTQEKAYLTGSGAARPLGVFVASNDGVSTSRDVSTGNTTTEVKFDGLIKAKYTLKQQYWPRSRWMFHRDVLTQIAQEKDGNGQYLWRESVRVGEPDRVLNLPMFMSEYAPNTMTTGQYVGILADWSFYHILDSLDLTVQRLLELYAETNQAGFISRYEGDGMPVLEEAFVRVKLA